MCYPNIALTGKFRSGKDEVAKYLCARYGYTRFAFGDDVRAGFHHMFIDVPSDRKPRAGYQHYAQLMRVVYGEDYWVDRTFRFINLVKPEQLVISDLRQPNEYNRCRNEGFVIIRVSCPDDIRIERARAVGDNFTDEDLNHETEKHVNGFVVDWEIDNSGSIFALHSQIDRIMSSYV